ncbi:MAG: PAS domain-containing sensor histidine kinase [Hormoscilla sp. GM102CHS1]|nr:PAS domain-containing sensor histidine kinase [Hormoscilla sp. GM102CHS1]
MGLALFMWWRARLYAELQKVLPNKSDSPSRFSISRLLSTTAHLHQTCCQLEQEINNWKQLLQVAPIGYLQVDDQNQLLWCNQQACQLLCLQLPASPRLLLEVVRCYELDHLIGQTRDSQKPCQQEWMLYPTCEYVREVKSECAARTLRDRPPFVLRGYGIPLPKEQVGVFLENRQEVAVLSGQRDRAFSDVAHELKTPLTSIRLVAETLISRLDPPLRNWIDRLLSEVIRLSDLVEILLDLGRLEKGAYHSLNLKTLDLPALISSAWLSLEPLARKKQLQFYYTGPESLMIQADEQRIYRVLINLLDNSIKYNIQAGEIKVKLRPTDRQIQIEVIDRGTGFTESELPYVFERFYRGDPSRARSAIANVTGEIRPDLLSTNGSGLGLAIVRQIIEAHQGYVRASNHPETGGAWLEVFLPRQQP